MRNVGFHTYTYAGKMQFTCRIAKTAEDCGLLLNAMTGFDPRDSTSIERAKEDFTRDLNQPLQGLKIGLPREYFGEGLAADVEQAVRAALKEYENWAQPWSIFRCRKPTVDPDLLRYRTSRSIVQPESFRRRALRLSREGLHRFVRHVSQDTRGRFR